MGVLEIIILVVKIAFFLATEGPELWEKIKEIIGWIRSMDDDDAQKATARELATAVDEVVRDWKAGDRSGRRLREFHARLAEKRGGRDPDRRPRRGRRTANGVL